MKFKSQVYTQASGSIGGVTYSHNIGGMYTRARATPKNPNSTGQQAMRAYIAELTSRWTNILTADQRAACKTYAANVTVLDKLGESRFLTAMNHYVRSNSYRKRLSLALVDDAPTVFNLGDVTLPTISIVAGGLTCNVAFTSEDEWCTENGAAMGIFFSRQQNPTIDFFKGPYLLNNAVIGNSSPPPTNPKLCTLEFPVAAGNRLFAQLRVSRADGRLSLPFQVLDTLAA
jgi:hypothetical protein